MGRSGSGPILLRSAKHAPARGRSFRPPALTTSCLDRYHGIIAARLDRHCIAAQAQRDRLERRSTRPTALLVEPATSAQDSATSAQDSATSAQDSATSAQDSAAPAAAATVHPIQCAAALPRAPVQTDSDGDCRDSPPLRRDSPASAAPSGGAVGGADAVWIAQLVQEAIDQQARSLAAALRRQMRSAEYSRVVMRSMPCNGRCVCCNDRAAAAAPSRQYACHANERAMPLRRGRPDQIGRYRIDQTGRYRIDQIGRYRLDQTGRFPGGRCGDRPRSG